MLIQTSRRLFVTQSCRSTVVCRRFLSGTATEAPVVSALRGDGILTLTLNRPEQHNALNLEMWELLLEQLHNISSSSSSSSTNDIRAVVLQAEGPLFSTGHDWVELLETAASDRQQQEHILRTSSDVVQALSTLPVPSVAAVQGLASGAGAALALAADVVVCSPLSQWSGPATLPQSLLTVQLPDKIGVTRAADMLLDRAVVAARQALEWGLVTHVTGRPHKHAAELAAQWASSAPRVVNKTIWNAVQSANDRRARYEAANHEMVQALQNAKVQAAIRQHIDEQLHQEEPSRPVLKQFSEIPSGAEMYRLPTPGL